MPTVLQIGTRYLRMIRMILISRSGAEMMISYVGVQARHQCVGFNFSSKQNRSRLTILPAWLLATESLLIQSTLVVRSHKIGFFTYLAKPQF